MGVEIERRFLVPEADWLAELGQGKTLRQGYLSVDPERTVRVRVEGDRCWLTAKGSTRGAVRAEFEFALPYAEGLAMLDELGLRPMVEKTRYHVPFGGKTWEIDVFHAENAGLIIGEVELGAEDEEVAIPPWVGEEITGDHRYSNSALVHRPYRTWKS